MKIEECFKIETEEDKQNFIDIMKSCKNKVAIYDYFGVSRSVHNVSVIKETFAKLGLDYDTFFIRPKYCLNCGKELTGCQKKFCSHACSAEYNNRKRSSETHKCPYCGKEIKGRKKYCNRDCAKKYHFQDIIKKWKNGETTGLRGKYGISNQLRRYLMEKFDNKCQLCGWGEVNEYTGNVPLQIHHIDGDCQNNREDNLMLLCPNCHSLTENFGSRNKNATRKDKRKRY